MQSLTILNAIRDSSAFNIPQAKRRKLNQHSARYTFQDGSILVIHATRSIGMAYCARGYHVQTLPLKINKQGV